MYLLWFPFLTEGNIIDILEKKDSSFSLQKQLKKDIGSIFLNKPTSFIEAFENQNFERALEIWLDTIQGSGFSKSATGSALYSYLLFQNGFEVLSLNELLSHSNPNQIDPVVSRLWKVDIDKSHPVWDYFYFPIPIEWQLIFSPETVFKIGSKAPLYLTKDQNYIKSLLALPLEDKVDVFSLEWLFVLSLIQAGDMDSATKILSWLLSKTKDEYRKDRINLTIARLLVDIGENQAGLHYYRKIKKLSYFWLLAQEEMSWLYLNETNHLEAFSTALALNYPAFLKQISPSMYSVIARSQLKNCDDKGAVQSLMSFKAVFFSQYKGLKRILDQKLYKILIPPVLSFYHSQNSYYQIGPAPLNFFLQHSVSLPQAESVSQRENFKLERADKINLFYNLRKDSRLKNDILLYNFIETKKRDKKTKFKRLLALEGKLVENLENKIHVRIEFLLKKELKNIEEALQNFHLIETELLYREYGAPASLAVLLEEPWFKDISLYKSNGFIYFPYNREEIWLDELSSYQTHRSERCLTGSYIL